MDIQTADKTRKIRILNDFFRKTFVGGQVMLTRSVADMDEDSRKRLMLEVQNFKNFTEDNDPHLEHDFGSIEMNGEKFFWKMDYYDRATEYGSEDPSDPAKTTRVLTIMRASEY